MTTLNLKDVEAAIAGNAAAMRQRVRMIPAEGPGGKVFPPTHVGGIYAWEQRRLPDDKKVNTVLLDSVQSQANRMEQALLQAYLSGKLKLPMIQVDFSDSLPDIGIITTLDAPHRIADAIFRECKLDDARFRDSEVGQAFIGSTTHNATGLFRYCPHALIFGVWDSGNLEGKGGNRFQRAVVSEIVGINAEAGVRTRSRIDPLMRTKNSELYQTPDGGWTVFPDQAAKDDKGPKKYGKKLSELNLGNVTPDLVRYGGDRPIRTKNDQIRPDDVLAGGVTIDYAVQTWVLSLPALRRLSFPVKGSERSETELNNAARTVLAALALASFCHMQEQGYDLRSRCLLIPENGIPSFELIGNDGQTKTFDLNAADADELYAQAVAKAKALGLPWQEKVIDLTPEDRLIEAAGASR
ncbi:MAG: type I-U CRISPR-associated RAMP protein Csb1/Cas7u [Methanothrix sp.]|nr:type I-U CRISPR-associated RAMP protein Csb1/Cas7u [Methanothrix sp.]